MMTVDGAGRLAAGELAVSTFQTYVEACQCLGHQYRAASLGELYNAEKGLDLAALDADARSLAAAARVAKEALSLQDNGAHAVNADWSGAGGEAASGYLDRHGADARSAVAQLCRSAAAVAGLRDGLSRAVDAKVEAVLWADDQAVGHRAEWTAAARVVIGGAGDLAAASEVVDQQVWPFVDQVICGQVLPALQAASDAVVAEYDSALAAVTSTPLEFGTPGSPLLSPGGYHPDAWPSSAERLPAVVFSATQTPGSVAAVPSWGPADMSAWPAAALGVAQPTGSPAAPPASGVASDASTAAPLSAAEPPAAAPPATSAGLPDGLGFGSGMGGLGQQLSDVVGGMLGAVGNLVSGRSGLGADGIGGLGELGADAADELRPDTAGENTDTTSDLDDKKDEADKDGEEAKGGEDTKDDDAEPADDKSGTEGVRPAEDVAGQAPAQSEAPTPAPPPEPVAAAPPVDHAPAAEQSAESVAAQQPSTEKTPCQIAADQLPQVGE